MNVLRFSYSHTAGNRVSCPGGMKGWVSWP